MRFVTVATESRAYFPWLLLSFQRYNIHLDILGWKQEWKGFNWRNKLMLDYVNALDDDEVVCFIDAYDMLMINDANYMEARFKAFSRATGYDFIVGCEDIKNSVAKGAALLQFGKCKGLHINAGMYIGFVKAIKNILQTIFNDNDNLKADDQVLLTAYCQEYGENVYIDYQKEFFISLVDPYMNISDHVDLEKTRAFFLHANAFSRLDNVLQMLGYPFDKEDKVIINKYFIVETVHKYWWNYVVCLICLILLGIVLYYIVYLFATKYRCRIGKKYK